MIWDTALVNALRVPTLSVAQSSAHISLGYHLIKGYTLRSYQVRASHKVFTGTPTRDKDTGVYFGLSVDGTNVHIDMGLGKTIIGLTAIADWYKYAILKRPTLIIAPLKVCQTVWAQEAASWSHTQHLQIGRLTGNERDRAFTLHRAYNKETGVMGYHALLINPEKLKWLFKYLREDWSFFDAVIIDDVALKDHRSAQFKIMSNYGVRGHRPPHRFKRAAKLTGTPSTAGLHNLWAPSYLMDHGYRLGRDFKSFEGRFFHKGMQVAEHINKLEINRDEAEARPLYEAREGAPERIHELLASNTIELDAGEYGVLPAVLGDASKCNLDEEYPGFIHRVELPDEIRPAYDKLQKEAVLEMLGNVTMAQNGGAKSMMCWQMANGAVYRTDDYGSKTVDIVHDCKLDKLVELIDTLNTNVVIPYYFQHDFARIVARLDKEGMGYASLKARNPERIIQEWNAGKIPILLLHPQSAGHGLNLQFGGHNFIWFTLLWSLERYLQTVARLARSGQGQPVGNHHIVCTKTTDELMLINLRQNGSDQEKFRAALREYQRIWGIDYITQAGF